MRAAAIALLLALFGLAASESALARKVTPPGAGTGGGGGGGQWQGHRHHHHHTSSFVGFGWGWWGPPAYYYPVPVVVEPVTYVEQGSSAAPVEPAWWYYCDAENAYYPHVQTCPAGWQRVPPAPPQQ